MSQSFELTPISVTALWGGRKLAHLIDNSSTDPVAEIWLASDVTQRPTRIANGSHAGQTLSEALGHPFPLLAKFIDANLPLSVQVHPDDQRAQARGFPRGKSEAWVILQAEHGSRIYAGLRDGVTKSGFEQDHRAGKVVDVLHSFEAQVGDIIYLPAGTVHAIGGGITLFEIQQSSDVTYRIYDWDRVDQKTGKPRELHIDDAHDCLMANGPAHPLRNASTLRTPYFELHVHRQAVTLGGDGRMRLLVAYGGATSGCVDVPNGHAVLIPKSDGECRLTLAPGSWLFECVVP
jgi:mannose-6-phosphate isomerase